MRITTLEAGIGFVVVFHVCVGIALYAENKDIKEEDRWLTRPVWVRRIMPFGGILSLGVTMLAYLADTFIELGAQNAEATRLQRETRVMIDELHKPPSERTIN